MFFFIVSKLINLVKPQHSNISLDKYFARTKMKHVHSSLFPRMIPSAADGGGFNPNYGEFAMSSIQSERRVEAFIQLNKHLRGTPQYEEAMQEAEITHDDLDHYDEVIFHQV